MNIDIRSSGRPDLALSIALDRIRPELVSLHAGPRPRHAVPLLMCLDSTGLESKLDVGLDHLDVDLDLDSDISRSLSLSLCLSLARHQTVHPYI